MEPKLKSRTCAYKSRALSITTHLTTFRLQESSKGCDIGKGQLWPFSVFCLPGEEWRERSSAKCNPTNLWHTTGNICGLLCSTHLTPCLPLSPWVKKGTESTTQISPASSCPSIPHMDSPTMWWVCKYWGWVGDAVGNKAGGVVGSADQVVLT